MAVWTDRDRGRHEFLVLGDVREHRTYDLRVVPCLRARQDAAVLDSLHAVKGCLNIGGCQVVPGLPQEQWLLTLSTSILGGLIAGFAAFPRQPGRRVEWGWVLLLSPLWVILFGVFGVAPIVTRTPELLPLIRNALGFGGGAIGAYLVAQVTLGRTLKAQEGG